MTARVSHPKAMGFYLVIRHESGQGEYVFIEGVPVEMRYV